MKSVSGDCEKKQVGMKKSKNIAIVLVNV